MWGDFIKGAIKQRILNETLFILKTEKTIREVAKEFNISKSTVHKDISERLKFIDIDLYNKVQVLMKKHILQIAKN